MNTGHRTVAGLLAVVAAMLAFNLIVKGTPPEPAPGPVTLVNGIAHTSDVLSQEPGRFRVWRFWSDGGVDMSTFNMNVPDSPCEQVNTCGPVVMIRGSGGSAPIGVPTLVNAVAHPADDLTGSVRKFRVWRFWSDGAVDMAWINTNADPDYCGTTDQCGPVVMIPGTCMADVDRNGEVATTDLLEVLAAWGPCK